MKNKRIPIHAGVSRTLILFLSFCWLGSGYLRLIHWSCRIVLDPDFFTLPFWSKSIVVSVVYLMGAGFLLGFILTDLAQHWNRQIMSTVAVILLALIGTSLWARPFKPDCEEVRERFQESGVGRDAHEGWFGRIKVDEPPFLNYSPSQGKVTWWGVFNKPFEYWGEPNLTASWYSPEGMLVSTIKVDAQKCRLAKATLKREYFQAGVWRVDIDCNGKERIDSRSFSVGSFQRESHEVKIL